MAYPNRIHRKGSFRHLEMRANETGIYPGMLLVMDNAGEVGMHSSKGGDLGDEVLVAEEDALQGRTVETVYADDDLVSIILPQKGTVIRMLLAEDQVLEIGEKVCSAGNGLIRSAPDLDSPSELLYVIGVAEEAKDLASGAGNELVDIRIS